MTVRKWTQTNILSSIDSGDQIMVIDSSESDPSLKIKRASDTVVSNFVRSKIEKTNLATGFSIAGGTSISKTLTVTENCTINQNLSSTSNVNFGNISGAGQLRITKSDGWLAGVFGGPTTNQVVMGSLSGVGTIGVHNSTLDAWRDFNIFALGKDIYVNSNNLYVTSKQSIFLDSVSDATAHLTLKGSTTPLKQAIFRYDTTSNYLLMRSIWQGTAYTPIFLDGNYVYLQSSGVTYAYVNQNGLFVNNIGAYSSSNINLNNNTIINSNSSHLLLRGVTNPNYKGIIEYNTTSAYLFIQSVNETVAWTPIVLDALSYTFKLSNSDSFTFNSAGINTDRINEFNASNGVRISSSVSIGSTAAPVAKLTGFGSTFLGVSNSPFSDTALAANQMQIYADEGFSTITLQYKYSNGTLVKQVILPMG